jgi:hypothetical protein
MREFVTEIPEGARRASDDAQKAFEASMTDVDRQILERLRSDRDFEASLSADPKAALSAAGLSGALEEGASMFAESEVSGHNFSDYYVINDYETGRSYAIHDTD